MSRLLSHILLLYYWRHCSYRFPDDSHTCNHLLQLLLLHWSRSIQSLRNFFYLINIDIWMLKYFLPWNPFLMIKLQHSRDEVSQLLWPYLSLLVFWRTDQLHWFSLLVVFIRRIILIFLTVKRTNSIISELVKHWPQWKDINFGCSLLLVNDLRSNIERTTSIR